MKHQAALDELVEFFESVTPATVSRVLQIYAPDAYFKDPFNEVRGHMAIEHLFAHMFRQVRDPRFIITARVMQEDDLFLTWDFRFHMPRYASREQCIRGTTHFRFDQDSRVAYHHDYWDAAEELYEKLPIVGSFMRLLKRIARK
jgi:steroid delta-isomerase